MKHYISASLLALFVLTSFGAASAQAPKAYKIDVDESSPLASPVTAVKVSFVLEKEVVKAGPYARYAQKYIGSMGALTDKVTYTIKSASLDYSDPERRAASIYHPFLGMGVTPGTEKEVGHVGDPSTFGKVSPDRMSISDRGAEDMARDAANMIYTLRKRRFDLLTGELGEGVYGEGLKAAIDEMARMENEYLSLFLGKQTVTTEIKEFEVVPVEGTANYIICRFSQVEGLLPDTDLSSEPIVLALTPDSGMARGAAKVDTKRFGNYYKVANWTDCRVMYGAQTITWGKIPVYQFGVTVAGK